MSWRKILTLQSTALSRSPLHAILGGSFSSRSSSHEALFRYLDGWFLVVRLCRIIMCCSLCLKHLRLFYICGQAEIDLGSIVLHASYI